MNRILVLLCCSMLSLPALAAGDTTVRVNEGELAGVTEPGDVRVFKGVPFAAPPVGNLRWRPPQPGAEWQGVRKADRFSANCMQEVGIRLPWTAEFMIPEGDGVSEDCLYLNVWTAAKAAGERRPVLVYIHGGGFVEGSGSVLLYNGAQLARKGVVVVTINYRVGALGFLAHPELTRESEHHSSGNYGLLDQIAALKWVQRNIAAFGGDPRRVTIAGQSAGAASVRVMIASPLAGGLFHRAIMESGGIVRTPGALTEAEANGVKYAESRRASSLSQLRALPAKEFVGNASIRFAPVADGWLLPEGMMEAFGAAAQNDVPTISGLNADEGSSSTSYGKATPNSFRKQAQESYGEMAEEFLKLYPADTEVQAGESEKSRGREQLLASIYLWAATRAKISKTSAYTYYFNHAIPWPEHPEFAVFHTSEVPYVFNNLDLLKRPWQAADRRTADRMSSYWVNFITTGSPNGKGLSRWPAFQEQSKNTMELGDRMGPRPIAAPARLEFFTRFFNRQGSVQSSAR